MQTARPRRSALYLPASNQKAIQKAAGLPCDVVILDLEDSVAPDSKVFAREQMADAVRSGALGDRDVVVRVNALDTPWGADDLDAAIAAAPAAILAPKISTATDIERYASPIVAAAPTIGLWAMIETAKSILRLDEIGASAARTPLSAFVLGTNDLAKETGAALTAGRLPFVGALGLVVTAARAHGLAILDGVYNDIEDLDGFAGQCRQGVEFGFDGKTLIHPKQIDICNDIFSPTAAALDWARRILGAFDLPENRGKGAIRVEGRMVEQLHLDQARRLLDIEAGIRARA